MRKNQRQMSLLFALFLSIGVLSAQGEGSDRPASQKAGEQTGEQGKPKQAIGSKQALSLARRIADYASGSDRWSKVDNIIFTVAWSGTGRRLYWDRKAARVRIETLEKPKGFTFRSPDFDARAYDLAKDKDLFIHPEPPRQAPKVWGGYYWNQEAYWLFAPLAVLDHGVRLVLEARHEDDKPNIRRLRMSFDNVGSWPRNPSVYVLHAEWDTGRVVRWDHYKKAKSKRSTSWSFDKYTRIGRMMLSLERNQILPEGSNRKPRKMQLLDVAINVQPPKDPWTSTKSCLSTIGIKPAVPKPDQQPASKPAKKLK